MLKQTKLCDISYLLLQDINCFIMFRYRCSS
nr:MAG TPA: hypothetical protein [Caudoviricetes sp.]